LGCGVQLPPPMQSLKFMPFAVTQLYAGSPEHTMQQSTHRRTRSHCWLAGQLPHVWLLPWQFWHVPHMPP
jgi:hypothetical protein